MSLTDNRELLHKWPHWYLLTAIKNTDFYRFKEIIEDIIDDVLAESHSIYVNPINYINPVLGDTYFDIVIRNGLMDFANFLLSKEAEFNGMNDIHQNNYIHFALEGAHVDMLAIFLEEEKINFEKYLEKYQLNLDISLHIAVRRNDLICAYMLLIKGARANISDNDDITALHLAAWKGNIDMVRLILMTSHHPPEIDNYRDYNDQTTRDVIENLPGLSLDANFFQDIPIPPIKEPTLKFFLSNSDETKCLKVMKEGFHGKLSHNVAEELLIIATQRNYCKMVQNILGKCKYPIDYINLNVVKNTAVIFGNHIILHELFKVQPEVTKDLIMNTYQLLKMSRIALKIDDISNRLKCLELILEQKGNIDVYCTDEFSKRKNRFEDSTDMKTIYRHVLSDQNNPTLYKEDENINEIINLSSMCHQLTASSSSSSSCFSSSSFLDIDDRNDNRHLVKVMLYEISQYKKISKADEIIIQGILALYDITKDKGEYVDILAFLLEQPTIKSNFEQALNNALHIAVRINNQICAYMLLCKGASASDPIDNITALHLAAFNDNVDMIRLILMASQDWPDIDSYKDDNNRTTREVIQNFLEFDSNFFEDVYIPRIKEQTLKFFLNNSDETKCLKVMKEGFQSELSFNVANELVNIAMRRNFCKIIQEILGKFNKSPVSLNEIKDIAVLGGNHAVLRELLKLHPEVTNDMIMNACRLLKISPQEIDNTSDRLKCLKYLILEQKNVDVRFTDALGNTPLHYAVDAKCYEAATLLLKRGSYLGAVYKSNNDVTMNIPAFVLSNYFNDCIQLKKEWTDDCTIEFDYRCLMPHGNFKELHETYGTTREMEVIMYIANNDSLKYLLKHPLVSSFIYIKLYKIRHVLYANFIFYIMFYFFLNTYVFSISYDTFSKIEKQTANNHLDTVFASLENYTLENYCYQDISLSIFTVGMLLFYIFQEIMQFVSCPRRYLMDLENWSQVLLIVLTFTLLCSAGFPIGIMIVLLSTWKLITMISRHLFLSTYIEMFRTVCLNYVRFFFPYLFFTFTFVMVFYTLLKKDNFSNLGLSFFKTIIMFTAEFDANEIPFSAYPIWSRIVFVLFVFYKVLVLFNLLNGLAINDIANILNKAEIIGLISRIRLIAYFERMVVGKPLWNSQCWWNPCNCLSNKILLFPHYLRDGKMTLKPYQNLIVYDKHWSTLKMDPGIIKHVKQIVCNKNEPLNEGIMNEFAKLQTKLAQIKVTLKCNAEENVS